MVREKLRVEIWNVSVKNLQVRPAHERTVTQAQNTPSETHYVERRVDLSRPDVRGRGGSGSYRASVNETHTMNHVPWSRPTSFSLLPTSSPTPWPSTHSWRDSYSSVVRSPSPRDSLGRTTGKVYLPCYYKSRGLGVTGVEVLPLYSYQ